jgi:type I restriction enzyme, S subunit
MAGQDRLHLAPRLRFPEFRDTGGWTTRTLRELASIVTERVGTTECTPYTVTSGVGLVSQQEKYGRTIAGNSFRTYVVLQKNDFAYNKSATKAFPQGFIARYVGEERAAVPNSIFTCFRVDDDAVSPSYLEHLFSFNLHGKWLRGRISVGARAHGSLNVDDDDVMALPVLLPDGPASLEEQQKIARCLTSLDEAIAAHGEKLAALKAHKQGLMQQMLPRKGELLPRLRFPEFQDHGEWKCDELSRCLKDLIDYRGKAPPKSSSGVPLITARNVRSGWLEMKNPEYIDADKYEEWMSKGIPEAGDVLFTTEAPLGNVARFPNAGKFALGQRIVALQANTDRCLSEFLFQSLLGPRMQEEIEFHSTGSTAKGIKSTVLVKISFCYPGREEQRRIADCLASLDDLIAAQTEALDVLRTTKTSLMQQLFPALEEI